MQRLSQAAEAADLSKQPADADVSRCDLNQGFRVKSIHWSMTVTLASQHSLVLIIPRGPLSGSEDAYGLLHRQLWRAQGHTEEGD